MCSSRWFIASRLLLSSLVCLLHAGTASAIHFDFQAVSPVSFSPVVTIERWDIKLAGDRKQPLFHRSSSTSKVDYHRLVQYCHQPLPESYLAR